MSARDCMQPVLQLEKPSGLASGVPAPAASGLAKARFEGSSRLPHQIERWAFCSLDEAFGPGPLLSETSFCVVLVVVIPSVEGAVPFLVPSLVDTLVVAGP